MAISVDAAACEFVVGDSPDMHARFSQLLFCEDWEFCVCKGRVALDGHPETRYNP